MNEGRQMMMITGGAQEAGQNVSKSSLRYISLNELCHIKHTALLLLKQICAAADCSGQTVHHEQSEVSLLPHFKGEN